jgi:flagellar FliJ protein
MSSASTHLPLGTLIELAQSRTDQATRRLGELQSAQLSAADKLQLLRDYRQDYLEQLNQRMHRGLALAQLCNYQAFLSTLDGAIEQQAAMAEQAHQRLDSGRRDWRQSKQKLNAYDTLASREAQARQRAQGRREQQVSDEGAARQFQQRLSLA